MYDLPERVLPAAVLAAPTPSPQPTPTSSSYAALPGRTASRAPRCLADYYRMRLQPAPGRPSAKVAIAELVEAGELTPVHGAGLEAAGVPPSRCPAAAHAWRAGPAQPVRPGRVGAGPGRGPVRLLLPHRDLRPGSASGSTATTCCRSCWGTAIVGAGRPQGRPGNRTTARAGRLRRVGRARRDGRGAGGRAAPAGRLAAAWTTSRWQPRGDLAPALAACCAAARWVAWVA